MQWELTAKEYDKAGYPYDAMPDHRDRLEFQKRCYNAFTREAFGPVTEKIKHFVRVLYQGKEYLYTNRERTGLLSDYKTHWPIWIPEWEIWIEPMWNTITEIDPKTNHPKTRAVGINGWITHYLLEWDPTKFDELMQMTDNWDVKFFVKKHGMLEPAIEVPNAEIYKENNWPYLFMQKWMYDEKYAELVEMVRYEAALAGGIINPKPTNVPATNVPTRINAPENPPVNTSKGKK